MNFVTTLLSNLTEMTLINVEMNQPAKHLVQRDHVAQKRYDKLMYRPVGMLSSIGPYYPATNPNPNPTDPN